MGAFKQQAVPTLAFQIALEHLSAGDCQAAIKNLKYTANAYKGTVNAGTANYMLGVIFQERTDVCDSASAKKAFRNAAILGISEALDCYEPEDGEVLDLAHFSYWDHD